MNHETVYETFELMNDWIDIELEEDNPRFPRSSSSVWRGRVGINNTHNPYSKILRGDLVEFPKSAVLIYQESDSECYVRERDIISFTRELSREEYRRKEDNK